MVDNVAKLGIEVEFRDVEKASDALDDLGSESTKAERSNKKLTDTNKRLTDGLRKGALAITAVAVGFAALAVRSVSAINQLGDLSNRLGIGVEDLQSLNFAFEQTGVSSTAASQGLQRLQRRVAEAAVGTGAAKTALEELGINAQDLARLSLDEQFRTVADALGEVKSSGDQTRLAFQLFDSEGVAFLQTINGLDGGLRNAEQAARDFGLVLSEEDVAAMQEVARQANILGQRLEGLVNTISVELARTLLALARTLNNDVTVSIDETVDAMVRFSAFMLLRVVTSVKQAIAVFDLLVVAAKGAAGAATAAIQSLAQGSLDPLRKFGEDFNDAVNDIVLRPGLNFTENLDGFLSELKKVNDELDATAQRNRARREGLTGGSTGLARTSSTTEIAAAKKLETELERARQQEIAATNRLLDEQETALLNNNNAREELFADTAIELDNIRRLNAAIQISIAAFEDEQQSINAENVILRSNISLSEQQKELLKERIILIQEESRELDDATRSAGTFAEQFENRIKPFNDSLQDAGGALGEVFVNSFNRAGDALTNFLVTGEGSFKAFANSIIADLIRIAIQQSIVRFASGVLGNLLPFQQGGAFVGGQEVAFANGGVLRNTARFGLSGGSTGLAGENGAEAIVPLSRTPSGELGIRSSGGGGTTINVTVENPNNSTDADQNGELIGRAIQRVIRQTTVSEIRTQQRPGNIMNRQRMI